MHWRTVPKGSGGPGIAARFVKRSYTFGGLVRDIAIVFRAMVVRETGGSIASDARLSPKFKERLMLAVTAVNKCRYCSWIHSKLALKDGCKLEEVAAILRSHYEAAEKEELLALAFAQHYAETGGMPERDAARRLLRTYGMGRASAIVTTIQAIMVGNLTGNTLDAFQARIRGLRIVGGSPPLEFVVFLIAKPLVKFLGIK